MPWRRCPGGGALAGGGGLSAVGRRQASLPLERVAGGERSPELVVVLAVDLHDTVEERHCGLRRGTALERAVRGELLGRAHLSGNARACRLVRARERVQSKVESNRRSKAARRRSKRVRLARERTRALRGGRGQSRAVEDSSSGAHLQPRVFLEKGRELQPLEPLGVEV